MYNMHMYMYIHVDVHVHVHANTCSSRTSAAPKGLTAGVAVAPVAATEAPLPRASCCCKASMTLGAEEGVKMAPAGAPGLLEADWLACCCRAAAASILGWNITEGVAMGVVTSC